MSLSRRAVSTLVAGLLTAAVASPSASAATPTAAPPTVVQTISMTSTHDPHYPAGRQLFETGTRTLDDSGGSTLDGISGGVLNGQIGFGLAPPAGQKLHVGTYSNVSYYPEPGRATVSFYYLELDNDSIGEVQILDLATDSAGFLTRYDVLYRLNTVNPRGYYFGEARLGEPEPADHLLSNHAVSWPLMPIGEAPVLSTQWLRNTGNHPLPVGRPSISGANASDFALYGDNCPATLPAGGFCTIRVGFSPRAIGNRSSALTWPIGSSVDHVALSGQAPDGFTEITSTGQNFADNGVTNEFVDGKYVQILGGGDNHAVGFSTTTTNDYEGTKWDNTWGASVSAPTGQTLRAGVFHTEVSAGPDQWGFDLGGGEVCEVLNGTLTIRQIVFNADGSLARADLNYQGTCDPGQPQIPGRIDAGPMTAQIRYRSTVSHPQYVNQAPAQVAVGSTVPITGMAAPGATVAVWFKGRDQAAFVQRRTLKADSNGRFASSYKAMDDCTYYIKTGDYLPVQYLTQIGLTMSAPAAVPYGSHVVVTGTGIPNDLVEVRFIPYASAPVLRNVWIGATGRWSYGYTATQPLTITAQGSANRLTAVPITVNVTG